MKKTQNRDWANSNYFAFLINLPIFIHNQHNYLFQLFSSLRTLHVRLTAEVNSTNFKFKEVYIERSQKSSLYMRL